ncbi:uncharacterized protein [Paralichthys olivaceus]|uniref:uncharacterized protein isoform X2 n=1 Tax=Paralichthys olivaceus TaxID=8255 RepID=UPI0037528B13
MRPDGLIILPVFILVMLVCTLEADSEESDCTPIINVRRNVAYEISLGQDLVINCTVEFCNKSAPTVLWYKLEENTAQHVNVSSSSHIKTEWKGVNHSEGVSFLKFQNILSSDSGLYRCRVGNDVGHSINVSVHGNIKAKTVGWTTLSLSPTGIPTAQNTGLSSACYVTGIMLFVVIVIAIYVAPKRQCGGLCCAGQSRNTPDLSRQP